jgi:hypothetical protein
MGIASTLTAKVTLNQRYWLLLALESAGELIILWHGIPPYRRLLFGQAFETGRLPTSLIIWFLTGATLIQIGYWANRPLELEIGSRRRVVLGHFVLFVGRLNFIFLSGVFATTFFVRFDVVNFSILGTIVIFAALFSVFCFTRELERLGRGLGV